MYVCTYVRMYVCMYVCVYVCMYVCMHACMYVCVHMYVYVCMYECMHLHEHLCKQKACICVFVHVIDFVDEYVMLVYVPVLMCAGILIFSSRASISSMKKLLLHTLEQLALSLLSSGAGLGPERLSIMSTGILSNLCYPFSQNIRC